MLKTRLKILTQCLLLIGVVVLWIEAGLPLWAFYVLCFVLGSTWRWWSRNKQRRSTTPESTGASEDGDLPPSLHEWLEAATHGLGEWAKRRIVKDIGSHYFDARDAAIEEGLPALEAEQRAVETLGNPRSARRGFRKVYLTRREEAWIKRIYSPETSHERFVKNTTPVHPLLGVLALVPLTFVGLVVGGPLYGLLSAILLMVVVTGVGTWYQYRWIRYGWARRAKVMELFGYGFVGFALSPAILLSRILDNYPFSKTLMAALPFYCAYLIVMGVRTLGKLPIELSAEERDFFERES